MRKIITLAGAIAGGVSLSQFPEFSQQYLQRLAGQVDALEEVVRDFDSSASKAGLTRETALAQLQGNEFLELRQSDLRNLFLRHARASNDLYSLRQASPLERMTMPHRLGDLQTLQATWQDYRPAVPVTLDGLFSALVGLVLGGGIFALIWSLLCWPFRRFARL